jgi:thioredoxin 1
MTTGETMTTDTKLVTITDDNFATEIESYEGLAMIDFWAAWCGPCRMVAPIVEELAEENTDSVKVGKLDVDENQKTAMKYAVRSIPSILFFKDGRHVDTVVGAVPKAALERKIEQHS